METRIIIEGLEEKEVEALRVEYEARGCKCIIRGKLVTIIGISESEAHALRRKYEARHYICFVIA